MPTAHNPKAEAAALLPPGYEARVLEPSPPAVNYGEFSDDPTRGEAEGIVVSPVTNGDITWHDYVNDKPHLHEWARERWLGPWRRLASLPKEHQEVRDALHRLAYFVMSPARHRSNAKIGLRYTRGGFGTPFFGEDVQVRLEGTELVVQEGSKVRSTPVGTIAEACRFVGIDYEPDWFPDFKDRLPPADPGQDLAVSSEGAAGVSSIFGFGCWVLEEMRAHSRPEEQPSLVQLWPEHFDIALEVGHPDDGTRAAYGVSPGDTAHPEPYVYVAAWKEIDRSNPFWNDPHFNGASLPYAMLLEADDQRLTALEFFRAARLELVNEAGLASS